MCVCVCVCEGDRDRNSEGTDAEEREKRTVAAKHNVATKTCQLLQIIIVVE